jgi:hypothetical protein
VRKRILCEQLERIVVEAIHMQVDKQTLFEWVSDTIERFNFDVKKGAGHE